MRIAMSPGTRSVAGDLGEREVIKRVSCPNCGRSLVKLPPNYPMYDVQCSGCSFRAQVKTCNARPKDEIFGAGWEVMDKVLKAGFMAPPLLVNFRWVEKRSRRQQVIFYPFVPRSHIRKRVLSDRARRAGYQVFNYVALSSLPHMVLFEK
jgi:hypothetical protein